VLILGLFYDAYQVSTLGSVEREMAEGFVIDKSRRMWYVGVYYFAMCLKRLAKLRNMSAFQPSTIQMSDALMPCPAVRLAFHI